MDDASAPCDCEPYQYSIAQEEEVVFWNSTGEKEDECEQRTIDGADGETEPTVLMPIQDEKDDQVRDGGQDDGRSAQCGSPHEELARDNRVAQTGDFAEG